MHRIFRSFVLLQMALQIVGGTSEAQEIASQVPYPKIIDQLQKQWPKNRTVRFVFHGHSVPAGYFKTPTIRRFDSYPVLFHKQMCERFPTAAIDVCITAIGGENSRAGATRFAADVLSLKPDVVFIDYSLNDRRLSLDEAKTFWELMVVEARQNGIAVVLLTPTPDSREDITADDAPLQAHADQVRALGKQYGIPVVDSYSAFQRKVRKGEDVESYLSQINHPNRRGHEVVAELLLDVFPSATKQIPEKPGDSN